MELFKFLRRLAGHKAEEEMTFSKMLGKDDMLFWGKIGGDTERIEYLKLLKRNIETPKGKDFFFWLVEGCAVEIQNLENKQETKKAQNKKVLKEVEIQDKIEAKVQALL